MHYKNHKPQSIPYSLPRISLKVIFFAVFILFIHLHLYSQNCTFVFKLSYSGSCVGMGANVWVSSINAQIESIMKNQSFSNASECESAREVCLGLGGTMYGCTVKITATPCSGCNNGGTTTDIILGPTYGNSFQTSNPTDEVRDWAENNEDLLNLISGKTTPKDEPYIFTGEMPGSIMQFANKKDDDRIIAVSKPHKNTGVSGLDDYINSDKVFKGTDPWGIWNTSDDFNTIDRIEYTHLDYSSIPKEPDYSDDKWYEFWGNIGLVAVDFGSVIASTAALEAIAIAGVGDLAIHLLIEDAKALDRMLQGEIVTTSEIFQNTLENSDLVGPFIDALTDKAVEITTQSLFIPEKTANTVTSLFGIGSAAYSATSRFYEWSKKYKEE
ncbi:MAG: hypothetical protein K6D59_04840 [Bacteroidales bacterium]|nr:hypothetical protein [Bacteroidales bacterium]